MTAGLFVCIYLYRFIYSHFSILFYNNGILFLLFHERSGFMKGSSSNSAWFIFVFAAFFAYTLYVLLVPSSSNDSKQSASVTRSEMSDAVSEAYESGYQDGYEAALSMVRDYPEDYIIPGTKAYDMIWENAFHFFEEEYLE